MTRWCWILVVAACGGGDGGPVARFEIPATGSIEWGVSPFPSDLYLGDDGTVDLASMPSTAPVWERVRTDLNERRGFCGSCPIFFPIDGELDASTVADAVVMLDPDGAEIPTEVEWNPFDHVVAVRARRDRVLTPGQQYIVGLTADALGVDGTPLAASSGMSSARASVVTEPAVAALEAAGVDRVVAVTSFTVEDPAVIPLDIKSRVDAFLTANGAPTLIVDRVWRSTDGTLDELMGTPAEDRPGLDVPSQVGSEGPKAMAHSHVALLIKGRMSSVRVISGAGKDLGVLSPDTVAGGDIPFLLAIPKDVDVSNLPVVVFHHGASGTLGTGLSLADLSARSGAALLELETFMHGERAPGSVDSFHELRGDTGTIGPDGWFESSSLKVGTQLFALDDVPFDDTASPAFILGGMLQMVADLHSLLAVARTSDLAPIAAADPALANVAFDRTQIYFVGVSLGTVIGTTTLATDDTVSAAVFDVPLSSLVDTLVENQFFRQQFDLLMMDPLDIQKRDYEPDQQASLHPLVGFMQWELLPLEPKSLVSRVVANPDRDLLWQVAGLDELAGTPSGNRVVAAAGVPAVGVFPYAEVVAGTAPLAGRGAWLFPQADHFMIGFNAGTSAVEPPGLPPFVERPDTLELENPIGDVHDQIVHFFTTHRSTGTGEITGP